MTIDAGFKWSALVLMLLSAGCQDANWAGQADVPVLVTRQERDTIENMQLTAMLPDATLAIVNGCVAAFTSGGASSAHTLVFPAGYTVRPRREGTFVLDSRGQTWGRIGEQRTLGGGEVTALAEHATDCDAPYWFVATKPAGHPPAPAALPPPTQQ